MFFGKYLKPMLGMTIGVDQFRKSHHLTQPLKPRNNNTYITV